MKKCMLFLFLCFFTIYSKAPLLSFENVIHIKCSGCGGPITRVDAIITQNTFSTAKEAVYLCVKCRQEKGKDEDSVAATIDAATGAVGIGNGFLPVGNRPALDVYPHDAMPALDPRSTTMCTLCEQFRCHPEYREKVLLWTSAVEDFLEHQQRSPSLPTSSQDRHMQCILKDHKFEMQRGQDKVLIHTPDGHHFRRESIPGRVVEMVPFDASRILFITDNEKVLSFSFEDGFKTFSSLTTEDERELSRKQFAESMIRDVKHYETHIAPPTKRWWQFWKCGGREPVYQKIRRVSRTKQPVPPPRHSRPGPMLPKRNANQLPDYEVPNQGVAALEQELLQPKNKTRQVRGRKVTNL